MNSCALCLILFQRSIGLPDVHSGYGFAIGNMAAFDMNDPEAVVSPGKVQLQIVWLPLWDSGLVCISQSLVSSFLHWSCLWTIGYGQISIKPLTENFGDFYQMPGNTWHYLSQPWALLGGINEFSWLSTSSYHFCFNTNIFHSFLGSYITWHVHMCHSTLFSFIPLPSYPSSLLQLLPFYPS